MRARLENEEKEAQGVKAVKEKQAGASIKAVTEEEDEWYWQAVALKTDAKSRFMMQLTCAPKCPVYTCVSSSTMYLRFFSTCFVCQFFVPSLNNVA